MRQTGSRGSLSPSQCGAGVGRKLYPLAPPNRAWFPHSQGLASLEGWNRHLDLWWASAGLSTCKSPPC